MIRDWCRLVGLPRIRWKSVVIASSVMSVRIAGLTRVKAGTPIRSLQNVPMILIPPRGKNQESWARRSSQRRSEKAMFWRKRFPIRYQLDKMDCGLACLDMIARYHGREYPRQFIRELCPHDRLGSSLSAIAHGAERLGFRTLSVKISFDDRKQKAPLPCIAFWPYGHYVVVHR